jgi:hypothetical protein
MPVEDTVSFDHHVRDDRNPTPDDTTGSGFLHDAYAGNDRSMYGRMEGANADSDEDESVTFYVLGTDEATYQLEDLYELNELGEDMTDVWSLIFAECNVKSVEQLLLCCRSFRQQLQGTNLAKAAMEVAGQIVEHFGTAEKRSLHVSGAYISTRSGNLVYISWDVQLASDFLPPKRWKMIGEQLFPGYDGPNSRGLWTAFFAERDGDCEELNESGEDLTDARSGLIDEDELFEATVVLGE